MKVTEITYQRKLSDGNYGSESWSMTCEVGAVDVLAEAEKLRLLVEYQLYNVAWRKRYEEALRIAHGEVIADGDSEEQARAYIVNYEHWIRQVQNAGGNVQF